MKGVSALVSGNGHEKEHRQVRLNMRKSIFIAKVTEHWNRLPVSN